MPVDKEYLSQPWLCEETDPFMAWIRNFKVPQRIHMPTNVKTYDGTEDPEDHLNIFQLVAKIERWAIPTWCHMFNSTLIGLARVWFHKLPPKSIDSYEVLQKAFLRNFSQQKKYIKDPVESTKSSKGRGNEMMSVTTTFLRGEVAVTNQSRKKASPTWRHHEVIHKTNFDKRTDFKSRHKLGRRYEKFTPLTKIPNEILSMEMVKFKAPPPMSGPAENQNKNKFCKFHRDKSHNTDECIQAEKAFQDMKQYIAELPTITASKPKEELIMYLCAAREVVSAVLLTERDSQQMLIYFVSHDLQVPKVNYNSMEKLVLALAKDIYPSPSLGRLHRQEAGRGWQVQVEEAITDLWTLFTDESSSLEGSGAGLIFTNPEEMEFTYALRFEYNASNNEAKYEAVINESYIAKQQSMIQYLEKARTLIGSFKKFSIEQVPRSENKKADALSKIASTSFAYLTKQVLVEVQKKKSIKEKEILMVVEEEGHSWMTPLLEYLTDDMLLTEAKRARAIKIKSRQYAMIDGVLYHNSFLEPWL
ncbi:reverse transcriptase domain-containing protein [Tanacetum coccineum]